MKQSTKIRIVVGVVMLAAAIALAIVFDGVLTGAHTQMWQRAIYIVGIIGTGLGALLSMLMGWKGYLFSYAGLSFVMIPYLLPKPWSGIFVAASLGAYFIWAAVSKGKSTKAASADTEEPAEEYDEELTEKERRLEEKLRPLTLVANVWNGRRYQLVCKDKSLIAYYVGSDFKGFDEALLQNGEDFRQPDKKDIVIPVESIRSINIINLPNAVREQAIIKTSGRRYRFGLIAMDEDSALAEILSDIAPGKVTAAPPKAKAQPEEEETDAAQPDMSRIKLFRVLKICFGVYLGLVNLPWMFIDVPYRLFSVLSIIALPVLLSAYLCFPGELTLLEDKECKGKVSIMSLMVFSTVLPALRSLIDFNFTSFGRLLMLTGVVVAMLLVIGLACSRELRRRKSVLVLMILLLAFYAFGAVAQVNFDFDNSIPTAQQAIMVDKHISRSRKGPDSYYIELRLDGGKEMQIKVGSEQYSSYSKGDQVTVYTFDGALDIPYAFAD